MGKRGRRRERESLREGDGLGEKGEAEAQMGEDKESCVSMDMVATVTIRCGHDASGQCWLANSGWKALHQRRFVQAAYCQAPTPQA